MVTRPGEGAAAELVETFLMESGKRCLSWLGASGCREFRAVEPSPERPNRRVRAAATRQPGSRPATREFCEAYAKLAVAQYAEAVAQHLPDVVPPVWSNDAAGHYAWCLGEPRELVEPRKRPAAVAPPAEHRERLTGAA